MTATMSVSASVSAEANVEGLAGLWRSASESVSEADVATIMRSLVEKASSGSVNAARLALESAFGKPATKVAGLVPLERSASNGPPRTVRLERSVGSGSVVASVIVIEAEESVVFAIVGGSGRREGAIVVAIVVAIMVSELGGDGGEQRFAWGRGFRIWIVAVVGAVFAAMTALRRVEGAWIANGGLRMLAKTFASDERFHRITWRRLVDR